MLDDNQDMTREWYIIHRNEREKEMPREEYLARQSDFEKKIVEKARIQRKEKMERQELTETELMNALATDIKTCVYDKGNQDKLPISYETARLTVRVIDS